MWLNQETKFYILSLIPFMGFPNELIKDLIETDEAEKWLRRFWGESGIGWDFFGGNIYPCEFLLLQYHYLNKRFDSTAPGYTMLVF